MALNSGGIWSYRSGYYSGACSRDDVVHIFYNWRDVQRTVKQLDLKRPDMRYGYQLQRKAMDGVPFYIEYDSVYMCFTFENTHHVQQYLWDLISTARKNGYVVAYGDKQLVIVDKSMGARSESSSLQRPDIIKLIKRNNDYRQLVDMYMWASVCSGTLTAPIGIIIMPLVGPPSYLMVAAMAYVAAALLFWERYQYDYIRISDVLD